jgi:16S rRNA (cytosine967-C5)-methyltransferase
LCLRVEHAEQRDAWIERLRAAAPGAVFELGTVSPLAILVRGAGDVRALPGFSEGSWSIQEEGSQLVGVAVGASPGDSVLDACAGRGNKSAVLARAVRDEGALDVADSQPDKLERLAKELARVGLAPRTTYAVDWAVGAGDCATSYDRVLVDAPCSGTGTIRRRPELLTRRQPENLVGLADLQRAIVVRVAERVRPGGRLLYAVCSVLREETEEVVASVLASVPALEPVPFDAAPAAKLAGPDGRTLRLLPHVHGTDGYFLASLRKKE